MLHLIKLSVGPESLSDLAERQARRARELTRRRSPEWMHVTRQTPRRGEELLDGGSIYWVIRGWLVARQRLLELRPVLRDGVAHCGLVHGPELIRVRPRPQRAFQGWRYLDAADAPADIGAVSTTGVDELPESMQRALSQLALL